VGVEVDKLLMHLIKVLVEIFGEFLEQLLDDVGGGSHESSGLRIPVYQCKSPIGEGALRGWRLEVAAERERERELAQETEKKGRRWEREGVGRERGRGRGRSNCSSIA
jgi:hypothetical protein